MIALQHRIKAFVSLGKKINGFLNYHQSKPEFIKLEFEKWQNALKRANQKNGWFIEQEVLRAFEGIAYLLNEQKLHSWLKDFEEPEISKNIGIIMAGNIPMVGFHDLLCVLISGNKATIKMSSQDEALIPLLIETLIEENPKFEEFITITKGKISEIDAIIATGSNNSARYFEHYFNKYPHIIRKNRNSVAIIKNNTTDDELVRLGADIFNFFGLGCRNVTKLYIEKGFDLNRIFNAIFDYQWVLQNNKYANNYVYHQTIFLMNSDSLIENGFLMLKEDKAIASPIAMLYYEFFENESSLRTILNEKSAEIQVVVSSNDIPFGKAQSPELWDYSDNVNTLEFLANLAPRKF